jgi:hypothetical protein
MTGQLSVFGLSWENHSGRCRDADFDGSPSCHAPLPSRLPLSLLHRPRLLIYNTGHFLSKTRILLT